MKKILAFAIVAGLCTGAFAEKKALKGQKLTTPVTKNSIGEGSAAGSPVRMYDWRGGGYYFYCGSATTVCVFEPAEDMTGADLALGNPYGAWITDMVFGTVTAGVGAHVDDSLHVWFDTLINSPPQAYLQDPVIAVGFLNLSVTNTGTIAGWVWTANLSGFLPGGGVPLTNQVFGYLESFYQDGGTYAALSTDCTVLWSSRGRDAGLDGTWDVGSSGDYFFLDVDGDGSFETTEAYFFGGSQYFQANFLLAFDACIPCDLDCNGTVNPFDINGFLAVLSGGSGCSPCAGDCDVNGTTNPFDINAFLACLGV